MIRAVLREIARGWRMYLCVSALTGAVLLHVVVIAQMVGDAWFR